MLNFLGTMKTYGLIFLAALASIALAVAAYFKKDNQYLKQKAVNVNLESKVRQNTISDNKETARQAAEKKGDERIKSNQAHNGSDNRRGFGKLRKRKDIRQSED